MNYIFNVEYFMDLYKDELNENEVWGKNSENIINFRFSKGWKVNISEDITGYKSFPLETQYPGLLIGIGNPHSIDRVGALKCGFSFDYVTGMPYIPGSSLKGMLRSYFPGGEEQDKKDRNNRRRLIQSIIKEIKKGALLDVEDIEKDIFENNDIFIGAWPIIEEKEDNLLAMEFITPHKEFKNPNPISLIKVKSGIKFRFDFILHDYIKNGEIVLTADDKKKIFKKLIVFMGIGAKTNVGFGKFEEPIESKKDEA